MTWEVLVAYRWLSGHITETVVPASSRRVALTSVSSNERLRRAMITWYLDCRTQDSAILGTWLSYGVVSLLEWTTGPVPPTPEPIGAGNYDNRDILHSTMAGLGWGGVFNNAYRVPEGGRVIEQDVETSRGDGENPGVVWWNWGLGSFTGAGVGVAFHRAWWRVLVDEVPVTP